MPLSLPDEESDADSPPREPLSDRLNDFITFRLLITPWLIEIVFWLGVIACIVGGATVIGTSFDRPNPTTSKTDHFSTTTFALGLAILLLGPLMLRLFCELFIIIFKIHDELKEANNRHRSPS